MCRYGFANYKPRYACFRCRKAIRRRHKSEVDPAGAERPARCPDCGLLMADMGLDFRPPSKSDRKGWTTAEALWEVGETFHSCGCSGPGYRPRNPAALDAFFRARLQEYRANLRTFSDDPSGTPMIEDAIATWRDRIRRIEAALAQAHPRRGSRPTTR
ncbi:MAG: hypothetical protein HOV81_44735 [Kofleriaceae bacterium]|nr:hypothetical protein [Kofleriaceae bacterium]